MTLHRVKERDREKGRFSRNVELVYQPSRKRKQKTKPTKQDVETTVLTLLQQCPIGLKRKTIATKLKLSRNKVKKALRILMEKHRIVTPNHITFYAREYEKAVWCECRSSTGRCHYPNKPIKGSNTRPYCLLKPQQILPNCPKL